MEKAACVEKAASGFFREEEGTRGEDRRTKGSTIDCWSQGDKGGSTIVDCWSREFMKGEIFL